MLHNIFIILYEVKHSKFKSNKYMVKLKLFL